MKYILSFLTNKKNFDLKKIESRNCIVKGQFKVNDNKFVTLKLQSIVVQSCLESNRSNLIKTSTVCHRIEFMIQVLSFRIVLWH